MGPSWNLKQAYNDLLARVGAARRERARLEQLRLDLIEQCRQEAPRPVVVAEPYAATVKLAPVDSREKAQRSAKAPPPSTRAMPRAPFPVRAMILAMRYPMLPAT